MEKQEIIKQLKDIINNELELGIGADMNETTGLLEIGIDSIALMSLFVYTEERFNFVVGEDALLGKNLHSLGDIAEYISSRVKA